jgi:Na+/proline symporter
MIAGFFVLGIIFYDKHDLLVAGKIDFEQILPSAIDQFVPIGLLGLLLAGLLAAFMSTFAGTLNAAQVYVTNDIYLKYINPKASNKTIKSTNYIVGIIVVLVSIMLGMMAKNVNQVLQLLVSALWGGYTASNVLKWYWWRFNSNGYFWGMLTGIVAAAIPMFFTGLLPALFPSVAPDIRILYFFPFILIPSLIGCIVSTYLSQPTDKKTLMEFYKRVRPWGFWKPIREAVMAENPEFKPNDNFKLDAFNVVIGIIWQTSLVILPIYFVLHQFGPMFIVLVVAALTTLILKFTWWDKLKFQES